LSKELEDDALHVLSSGSVHAEQRVRNSGTTRFNFHHLTGHDHRPLALHKTVAPTQRRISSEQLTVRVRGSCHEKSGRTETTDALWTVGIPASASQSVGWLYGLNETDPPVKAADARP
jgi:hypothetical protein